jgi:2-haloacid dehalogenase
MEIRAVVFDAYGTLFDINSAVLEASLSIGLQGQALSNLWRRRQLEFTWLWSLMGKYEDFWSLTRAALDSVLQELGVERDAPKLERLMQAYWEPRLFPDVMPALDALPRLPLVILSNGSPEMLQSAVRYNHLESRFAQIISADRVKIYKPSPQVYVLATDSVGLSAEDILFISSNWWDAWGAKAFGYTVCCCNRSERQMGFSRSAPDLVVARLDHIADSIAVRTLLT